MKSQQQKADYFASLHQQNELFLLANAWDTGSAKMFAALGFKALATTSAGFAFSQGKRDWVGENSRQDALAHAKLLVEATPLPVSADLENGFGRNPEAVAKTVIRAAEAGLVGCTIEDTSGSPDQPIYEQSLAVERIIAGVEAARSLDFPFMLTARAENFLHDRPDLDDTLQRLLAYETVGADVLYAPGLPDLSAISTVCKAIKKPVNVVAGIGLNNVTLDELSKAGVRRVSIGSALARTAYGAAIRAAQNLLTYGELDVFDSAASFNGIEQLIQAGSSA